MTKAFVCLIFVAIPLLAQQRQPVTSVQPDVMVFFNLSVASSGAQATPWLPSQPTPPAASAGTSLVIDNHQAGAYAWTVMYAAHGFGTLSLALQQAPDNAAGTGPGTWSTTAVCGGTECLGINPNTAITQAITTTKSVAPWFRMNLTAKTNPGSVIGVLYGWKINAAANGGAPVPACPGGLNTQVQYNNAGACAGTSGETADATRVYFANGTGAAPGISFADGSTGLYREAPFIMATLDSALRWAASGVATNVYNDNDSWRCGEGDELGQRGACESWSFRVSNNARFWDMTDTFLNWGDPAGGGAGTRAGIGRFSADGASATVIHVATADAGTHIDAEMRALISTGYTFGTLPAAANGTFTYCSDCTVTSGIDNTCAGTGSGAWAQRLNGAWKCSI